MRNEFGLIESILWKNKYVFLEQHMRRLGKSAQYFGFQFIESKIREQLVITSCKLKENTFFKVRIVLSKDGDISVSHDEIRLERTIKWKIAVSPIRTNSKDVYLYHKTTNRNMCNEVLHKIKKSGFDEVVFCNEKDEITEGSFTNILLKISGVWVTPDLSSGLLPGVYRQLLIGKLQSKIQVRPVTIHELSLASHVCVCNSVRGCIKVDKIDFTGV
jgi:para-aminobenzoate synthetase/4-amino-4-deoxychorismate lyase